MAYIYKLTDTRNGKIYIGQHNGRDPKYWSGGTVVNKIAKKHGKAVFKRDILKEGDFNPLLLNELEKHFIQIFNSIDRVVGYNLVGGGGNTTKRIYQYGMDGKFIKSYESMLGAAASTGINYAKISNVANGVRRSSGGYFWSYEKLDTAIVRDDLNSKEIHRYDLSGHYIDSFKSRREAGRLLGLADVSSISYCARGRKLNTAYGFIWSYVKAETIPVKDDRRQKSVHRYCSNGKYIDSYASAGDAAKLLGFSLKGIRDALYGNLKTYKKFKWNYIKEEDYE